jgi:hypothetical protein
MQAEAGLSLLALAVAVARRHRQGLSFIRHWQGLSFIHHWRPSR